MKIVLDWIKSNILTDIAIVVTLAALVFLGYVISQGGGFRQDLAKRAKEINNIKRYSQAVVEIPASDPNLPPTEATNVTVNPWVIAQTGEIQNKMDTEAQSTFSYVVENNQAEHGLMLDGMLPSPKDPHAIKKAYLEVWLPMLLAPPNDTAPVVGINAGLPPTDAVIHEKLERVLEPFVQDAGSGGLDTATPFATDKPGGRFDAPTPTANRPAGVSLDTFNASHLTQEDQAELRKSLELELNGLLQDQARTLGIYAQPIFLDDQMRQANPDGPLDIADWALDETGRAPTAAEIYEAQLEYWIQQDLIAALALANRVGEPEASVLTAPVKQLIKIDVLPGYVGLHSAGGMDQGGGSTPSSWSAATPTGPGHIGMGSTAPAQSTLYPQPPSGAIGDPEHALSNNFFLSPTGRVSNALYDVRHARVRIIADATQLPALFNAIARINMMTVIDVTLTDIDSYQAAREGRFLFGGDAVEVDLLVESLWMRAWTRPWMPTATRAYLGADAPADPASNDSSGFVY